MAIRTNKKHDTCIIDWDFLIIHQPKNLYRLKNYVLNPTLFAPREMVIISYLDIIKICQKVNLITLRIIRVKEINTFKFDFYPVKFLKDKIRKTNEEFSSLQKHHKYQIYHPKNKGASVKKLVILLKDVIGKDCYLIGQTPIEEKGETIAYQNGCMNQRIFKACMTIINNMKTEKLYYKNDETYNIVKTYLNNQQPEQAILWKTMMFLW